MFLFSFLSFSFVNIFLFIRLWKRQIIDELSREEYNLRSDYMEMMIQVFNLLLL